MVLCCKILKKCSLSWLLFLLLLFQSPGEESAVKSVCHFHSCSFKDPPFPQSGLDPSFCVSAEFIWHLLFPTHYHQLSFHPPRLNLCPDSVFFEAGKPSGGCLPPLYFVLYIFLTMRLVHNYEKPWCKKNMFFLFNYITSCHFSEWNYLTFVLSFKSILRIQSDIAQ